MSSIKANFWLKLKENNPIIALAPMAGITDSAFRQICRKFGADVIYSEMISALAICYGSKKTLNMLKKSKKEKPLVIQLFGKRPDVFAKAAKMVEEKGADGIDINFGCPAKKVIKNEEGVFLMSNLSLSKEIVQAIIEAVKIPVSLKIRAGINLPLSSRSEINRKVTAFDFVKNIMHFPVSAIMIHGRTYEQGFSGEVDYEMIKKVKELVGNKMIILANGGIKTPEDAKIMIDKTGVDGIGIAQAALGKPWIFEQIKNYLETGKYDELNLKGIKKIAIEHAKLVYKSKGDYGIIELRKYLLWYVKGQPDVKKLRKKIVQINKLNDIKKVL